MYEKLIQKLLNRNVGAIAGNLRPTDGTTSCTVETGIFPYTYDGSTSTGACFKKGQTCTSDWYWSTPVNVTKLNIRSHYYYPNSRITAIWGRVDSSWVLLWGWGIWMPAHATWDSKVVSCNNCTGIRIAQAHFIQPSRPCITEATVDYEAITPPTTEGSAAITSITHLPTFTPNVNFKITTRAINDGGDDYLFIQLIDTDMDKRIKKYTSPNIIPSGGIHAYTMVINRTETTDFHGRIEAGHIE